VKCLVTGGAGFIGSHLAAYLAARGDEVVVLDNFSTGKRDNLHDTPVRIVEGDIRDLGCVLGALRGVNTVFHQAALGSVIRSVEDPLATHEVNVTGTLNVLEASRKSGVRRVVFASSSSVYGDQERLPKDESMPAAPCSPYAVSKRAGELYAAVYAKLYGLETVALRYFNVFGPRQDPASEYAAVIPKFLHHIAGGEEIRIYGDGHQTRDFTYVENVVLANLLASTCPVAEGQAINVACGERRSLLELVGQLEAALQRKARSTFQAPRAGDVRHSLASIDRAQQLLGYAPAVGFDEGIRRTAAAYLE
jgi:UDP-glucose 4-epimerase